MSLLLFGWTVQFMWKQMLRGWCIEAAKSDGIATVDDLIESHSRFWDKLLQIRVSLRVKRSLSEKCEITLGVTPVSLGRFCSFNTISLLACVGCVQIEDRYIPFHTTEHWWAWARASPWNPLVPVYASQVIQLRSQCLCPGNHRPCKVFKNITITKTSCWEVRYRSIVNSLTTLWMHPYYS